MDCARPAVVGLLLEINSGGKRMSSHSMTFAQLCNHFEQREVAYRKQSARTLTHPFDYCR
jgi:DNA phosphorothioation-dependent restriction protein DptG